MSQRTAVVFGGSSGIGEAAASSLVKSGRRVTLVARNAAKLEQAAARMGGAATVPCDASDPTALATAFERVGPIDELVISVSGGKGAGLFTTLQLDELRAAFSEKLFVQLAIAKAALPHLQPGASITFISAASVGSVIMGTSGLAAVNGALESMIPILAYELAPVRVNAVSPGIVNTPWWNGMPKEAKESFFRTAESTLPVRRVGHADEVGALVAFVATNGFMTGSVYTIDGGSHLITQ